MQVIHVAFILCLLAVFVESTPNKNCDDCESLCGEDKGNCCPACEAMRTGACPKVEEGQVGICLSQCKTDADCSGNKKCCSNGCGHVCMDPKKPNCGGRKSYNNGRCSSCKCHKGFVMCYYISCPRIACLEGFKLVPGKCCPVCKNN